MDRKTGNRTVFRASGGGGGVHSVPCVAVVVRPKTLASLQRRDAAFEGIGDGGWEWGGGAQ